MLEVLRPRRLRIRTGRPLVIAVMGLLTATTLGVVALLAMGRLEVIDAIVLAAAPWALLAAAFRPDWLLLALIAMPASLTTVIQTRKVVLLVGVALLALLVTRRGFRLGLGTGLAALAVVDVAGHLFLAHVGQDAMAVNQGAMLNLTYYVLLALLAFNLAVQGELDGDHLGAALVMGVWSTLVVGLAGYGNAWFESGPDIITHSYLAYLVAAALGVRLAQLIMTGDVASRSLGGLLLTGALLCLAVLSVVRASWIAVVITFALLAFRSGRRRHVFVLMMAILLALLTPTARQQISRSESGDVVGQLRTGEITTGRWELWTALWEQAQQSLPWGNGFGYMWSLSSEDLVGSPDRYGSHESGVVPPHNDFIYLLVEFGIPGLLLLAFFWVQLFRAFSQVTQGADALSRRSGWLFLGVLVTGLMVALFDDLFSVRPFAERFFPVAGFVFGLAQVERARRRERAIRIPANATSASSAAIPPDCGSCTRFTAVHTSRPGVRTHWRRDTQHSACAGAVVAQAITHPHPGARAMPAFIPGCRTPSCRSRRSAIRPR
ncbi:MAG: hypothetical protein A2W26_02925 [Acidobacteria bacterium RBG_16_64_8]|nr:MAG: hypothetical protein A2W26_02925 [Acidobacteria bacterium RBG_16_64_8]